MKLTKIFFLLTLAGSFVFNACKDDEKEPDPSGVKTKYEMLTDTSGWKLESATCTPPIVIMIGSATIEINSLSELGADSCQTDNLMIFNTDSTITMNEGKKKCNASDPQSKQDGKWRFLNGETQIEITNSQYFQLISSTKVILDQVSVSEARLSGQADYNYTHPTNGQTTSKVNFVFTK